MSLLSDFIRKELDKGNSISSVKKKLLDIGTDKKVIEHEFAKLGVKEEKKAFRFFSENKRLFLFALLGIIAIVLVVMLFIMIFRKDACLEAADKDNCYARKAMEKNNVKYCKDITSIDIKDACASRLWSINRCLYMQRARFEQSEVDDCKRQIFLESLG